jgi:tol-pal system protein YbgF
MLTMATGALAGCATTGTSDVARLERRVRELQDQVYRLEKSQEENEGRIAELEGRHPAAREASGAETPAPPPARAPVRALPSEEPAGEWAVARETDPDAAWERAKNAYDQVRFAEAVPLLLDFVERFPGDDRAVEALFLVGESFYAEANFPQAAVEFGKVVQGYPRAPRAADALYKVALSYYELGYEQNALEHLDRLEKSYPGSAAAEAGKPLLERLRRRR